MERESEGVNKRVEHLILLISGQPEVSCCVRSGQDCLIRDTETQPGQQEREEERARTNNLNLPKCERERGTKDKQFKEQDEKRERPFTSIIITPINKLPFRKQTSVRRFCFACTSCFFTWHHSRNVFCVIHSKFSLEPVISDPTPGQPSIHTCGPSSIVQPVEECKIWALENHKTSLVHLFCVCCALKLKSI